MTSIDDLAQLLYELKDKVDRLGSTSQLQSSTVGDDAANTVQVDEVVSDAAVTNDAVPLMQDDTADSNQGVSELQTIIAAMSDDLDARFELADQDLSDVTEDLTAAQQEITDAFGQRIDGLSDRVDEIVAGAGGTLILFSDDEPDGTAPTGSTWFMINEAENIVGQWQQTGTEDAPVWTPREIESTVIANLDVAKLTAGQAALAQVVAQKIAASTASIQTVNVGNLFVTDGATMAQAVINYLFANVMQAKKITADMIDVNSLSGVTLTGTILKTAASGQRLEMLNTRLDIYTPANVRAGAIVGQTYTDPISGASTAGVYVGAVDANGAPVTASCVRITSGGLGVPGTASIQSAYGGLFRLRDIDVNGYYGVNGMYSTRQGTGRVTAEQFAIQKDAAGNGNTSIIADTTLSGTLTRINADEYADSSGRSVMPSRNYAELTATMSIQDSTPTFVTGWSFTDNSTNRTMVTISGTGIVLPTMSVNPSVYTVDIVSQTPATAATLANRNYLQLQAGSAMDSNRIARFITRSENLISGGSTFSSYGDTLQVASYQTTGATRSMTFTVRITRFV